MSDEINNTDLAFDETLEVLTEFIEMRTSEINTLKTNTANALTALSQLAQKVYGYSHEDFAVQSLKAVYADIIAEDSSLADVSAVGFSAILKTGDSIYTRGNVLYINGTLCNGLTSDGEAGYTFTGENGNEYVNVWYFESNGTLDLNASVDFDIINISILKNSATPTIDANYTKFATGISSDNFTLSSAFNGKRLEENGLSKRSSISASANLVEYHSDLVWLSENFNGFANKTSLRLIDLPECVYLGASTNVGNRSDLNNVMFVGCSNPDLILNIPKVEYICGAYQTLQVGIFHGIYKVVIPASVTNITHQVCSNNSVVELNCKNAVSISDNWCRTAPTNFRMCADWGASINIATAAANWAKEDFIDLFTNKLRNMGDDVREIKIPSAVYDELTDEEFEIAEDKGWTVGC